VAPLSYWEHGGGHWDGWAEFVVCGHGGGGHARPVWASGVALALQGGGHEPSGWGLPEHGGGHEGRFGPVELPVLAEAGWAQGGGHARGELGEPDWAQGGGHALVELAEPG
jgi:hypothetical protein